MKLRNLLLSLCLLPSLAFSQTFSLRVDTVSTDIGLLVGALGNTDLTGYACYQVVLECIDPADFVSSVSGDAVNPTYINTTTTFFHSPLGGLTAASSNPLLYAVYPDLAYDSYVTIGLTGPSNAMAGEANPSTVQSFSNPWATNFDPGGGAAGGSIAIDDAVGGAWYALNGDVNAIAGADLDVLIGQFVTTGDLSGQVYAQFFPLGLGDDDLRLTLPIGAPLPTPGCTDMNACNYDIAATEDDGTCTYPTGYPINTVDCSGDCINDVDIDGICDEDELAGCTDIASCNYNGSATDDDGSCADLDACGVCGGDGIPAGDCDCNGNQDDALGVCGGLCAADGNNNGICDDEETAGCSDPGACNYDMDAIIDDGSCLQLDACDVCGGDGIPVGDCDCNGNQEDALGVCGGTCDADTNNNGVCDSEETEGCSDPGACNYDGSVGIEAGYCLEMDVLAVHTDGALAGMTTYRAYVSMANPTDFLSSVSGDNVNQTLVMTTTSFYQNPLGGATAAQQNPLLFAAFPDLAYDSYVTIGMDAPANAVNGEAEVSIVASGTNPWQTNFEAGGNIAIDDAVGGAWFALNGDVNGLPDADGRVMIGQFTTDGDVSGNFFVQIFPEGDGPAAETYSFEIGSSCMEADPDCDYTSCLGCTDEGAFNYDPDATQDDETCFFLPETVWEIIADSPMLTSAEDLMTAAGMNTPLMGAGPWTVFAPTDAAIAAAPDAVVAALMMNPALLFEVMNYHVASDSVTTDMMTDGMAITMSNGQDVTIATAGSNFFVNGIQIIFADLLADNGVVHVIEDLLMPEIGGCMTLASCNFNPLATYDDESCDFDSCTGCLNAEACNYDAAATLSDASSCEFPIDIYEVDNVDCDGNCLNDADVDGVCDEDEISGCTDMAACNYDATATDDDGSCESISCDGCTDMASCNYDSTATIENGTCLSAFDLYGSFVVDCDGNCLNDEDLDGVCDEDEIIGCQDITACNYDDMATDNDQDLCDFSCYGCMDQAAANYDQDASIDSGDCVYCGLVIEGASGTDPLCATSMDGTISIDGISGNFGSVTYSLDGGEPQAGATFAGLLGGLYSIAATDSLGCSDTVEVSIAGPTEVLLIVFATNVDCYGDTDGELSAEASGGTGDLNYTLDGEAAESGLFTGLAAGSYSVGVSDANSCSATIEIDITEPEELLVTVDAVVDPSFEAIDGTIDITATGGTGAYTFDWTGPDATYDTEDLSGLDEGTYTLEVTDENGCIATAEAALTDIAVGDMAVDFAVQCVPNPSTGFLFLTVNQPVNAANIQVFDAAGRLVWSASSTSIVETFQMDLSALSTGVYQVRLTDGSRVVSQAVLLTD
jgi:hypothetical protein